MPTVFVVDNDVDALELLRRELGEEGLDVRTFSSADELLAQEEPQGPACALIEIRTPDGTGLNVQEVLSQRGWRVPLILMAADPDVSIVVRAMEAGAISFLEKPFRRADVIDCVNRALQVSSNLELERRQRQDAEALFGRLTPREYEVMRLLVSGKSSKEIAVRLGLSPRTVEQHRGRIMKKTELGSLPELVAYALRCGIGTERGDEGPQDDVPETVP